MALKYTIRGEKIIKRKFYSMIKELNASPIAMQKIAYLGIRDINDHFVKSQDSQGKTWPEVARGGKPLLDTGLLRNSTRYQIRGNTVKLFNNTHYGKYHQYGWGVRQREWMWISKPAWVKILNVYKEQIVGAYR